MRATASPERRKELAVKDLASYVVSIPDYPKPGILFRDITGILGSADGLRFAIDQLADKLEGVQFDAIVSMESRGFLFGMPLAYKLNKAFVPVRKQGKLPRETVSASYELEYGTDALEMHKDALKPGERVVVVDIRPETESVASLIDRYQVTDALFINNCQAAIGMQSDIRAKALS